MNAPRWIAMVVVSGALAGAGVAGAIEPTVSRPPSYWSCRDDLSSRIVVTFLDTDPPSAILARGDKRVTAVLQDAASGAKYMASGGILFWIKGKEALVEWPVGTSYRCASLD
jgi:membrane-bound inhibitor of C-type lysozyme